MASTDPFVTITLVRAWC